MAKNQSQDKMEHSTHKHQKQSANSQIRHTTPRSCTKTNRVHTKRAKRNNLDNKKQTNTYEQSGDWENKGNGKKKMKEREKRRGMGRKKDEQEKMKRNGKKEEEREKTRGTGKNNRNGEKQEERIDEIW